MKGRSIHNGLILIRDVIEYQRAIGGHALIVALDQRKAFDMVDHRVLLRGMAHFGFSPDVVKLIEPVYEGNHTNIKINGELSDILCEARLPPFSIPLYCVSSDFFEYFDW